MQPTVAPVANRVLSGVLQPKLEVGAAGDRYEQEADQVARTVVAQRSIAGSKVQRHDEADDLQMQRTRSGGIQRTSGPEEEELQMKRLQSGGIQRTSGPEEEELQMLRLQTGGIQRQEGAEMEEEELQMSRIQRSGSGVIGAEGGSLDQATEAAIARAGSGGRPLDAGLQREMGAAIGADFSSVRVHTGPESDALNQTLQARAFTTGSDVFVRSGDYKPETRGGQELLAHELTHVVQQGAAPQVERDGV